MVITVLAVGKVKEDFYRKAIGEFEKRLGKYCRMNIVEVADERTPDGASAEEERQIKEKEGERLLRHVKPTDYVCVLAIEGEQPDSIALARKIQSLEVGGTGSLVFVIGGSLGLCERVMARSDWTLSFSNMTFPHQLMRVILLEQIYRSYRIIRHEPYHK